MAGVVFLQGASFPAEIMDNDILEKVKRYVRQDSPWDDSLLTSLMLAAKQYLLNAGVCEPGEEATEQEMELYIVAISLKVALLYNGPNETLERALTAIILQIRTYKGVEA